MLLPKEHRRVLISREALAANERKRGNVTWLHRFFIKIISSNEKRERAQTPDSDDASLLSSIGIVKCSKILDKSILSRDNEMQHTPILSSRLHSSHALNKIHGVIHPMLIVLHSDIRFQC